MQYMSIKFCVGMAIYIKFSFILQKNKTERSLQEYLKQVLLRNKVIFNII